MKSLVIAEKPSVARDIARVLHCGRKLDGGLEGDHYIVTWGLGHLVTLADPEDYDPAYKEWKQEDLPIMPSPFRLEVIRQTGKQFSCVKALLHRKDISDIIIATDAGREGELVGSGSPPSRTRQSRKASLILRTQRSTTACTTRPSPARRLTGWSGSTPPALSPANTTRSSPADASRLLLLP